MRAFAEDEGIKNADTRSSSLPGAFLTITYSYCAVDFCVLSDHVIRHRVFVYVRVLHNS